MKSKVLLIDDSVTIHRVIDLSIDIDRYDIVKVFSKEDAALKMQSEQYDYILLDNKLDNIIISEYIKELKAAQLSASIILLVGAFDRFDESDLEKTGANDYLVKPFDSQSLNEKLSSDADVMPAEIVEKIAEADFARDNDDYIAPTSSLTSGEVVDGLSKQEYLENLEEVQPDDLTDNGYAEDLDTTPSLEFDNLPKEVDGTIEQSKVEEQIEELNYSEENTVIEESQEEVISTENNDVEQVNTTFDEHTATEEVSEPVLEQNTVNETATVLNEDILDTPTVNENLVDDEVVIDEPLTNEEINSEIPLTAEALQEENVDLDSEEIEIPDNITAVHNPVLPDIDDAADISDEYVMKDNLEEVDSVSKSERLDEFPDFPDVDDMDKVQGSQDSVNLQEQENNNIDISNDMLEMFPEDITIKENISEEINQSLEDVQIEKTEHQEEVFAEEKEHEGLLVDDDDWLSDAPSEQEEMPVDTEIEKNFVENEGVSEEHIAADENTEEVAADIGIPVEEIFDKEDVFPEIQEKIETTEDVDLSEDDTEEITDSFDTINKEYVSENLQEEIPEETVKHVVNESLETSSLEDVSTVSASIENMDENADNTASKEDGVEENIDEAQSNEEMFGTPESEKSDTILSEESGDEESILPVHKKEVYHEPVKIQQAEVRQAEEYNPETAGRFGGITVTISRDEIIAMLGNAIDKHFLEEAVKEVIASNMKDIVRNIVPAIAEKYIKEEIERLKNDE